MHTRLVTWDEARDTLMRIRFRVFVEEQQVPAEMELDEHDPHCDHLLAYDEQGNAIGTARLLPDGHIGRLAVLPEHRGSGVGSQLLKHAVALAQTKGFSEVVLNAQTRATRFYEKHGFVVSGEPFMEAGIEHVCMRRRF